MLRSRIYVTLAVAFSVALSSNASSQTTPTSGDSPSGRVLVCASKDLRIEAAREVRIPATTVFRDGGTLKGDIRDPWEPGGNSDGNMWAAFAINEPITLTKIKPCAEVGARMVLSSRYESVGAKASDNRVWYIDDVLNYIPSPRSPPSIEFGRLVDDIAVKAKVITDLNDTLKLEAIDLDEASKAKKCRENAQAVATRIRGRIGGRTISRVVISHPDVSEIAFHCDEYGNRPYIVVAWPQAKPNARISEVLSEAGSFFVGITPERIKSLLDQCFVEAVRRDADGIANKEFDGVRMECHAYFKKLGISSVTLFRRFGSYPSISQ